MYRYRDLTSEQRAELIEQRRTRGYPPHSPPHLAHEGCRYLLTAACYEHKCHLALDSRRQEMLNRLFETLVKHGIELRAWVVLPNHYHLLAYVPDFTVLGRLFGSVHGSTAYQWNREDHVSGRKVWYRYADRAIRSERHYFTTLNYIHFNPVKHRWVEAPYEWSQTSVHWYLEYYGREWLRALWVQYPVRDYGRHWDWDQP
jgi:putative transposase